jgi:hypothetical protein
VPFRFVRVIVLVDTVAFTFTKTAGVPRPFTRQLLIAAASAVAVLAPEAPGA